ncbi:MAG: hypothetical protein QXX94_06115 [Candidatus Bathyarchaeia archaeon]
MSGKYIELNLKPGVAYIREDKIGSLKNVDAIIFDCDGVLIDIRESYDKAILKTVSQIFEWLTGNKIPEEVLSNEAIFLFRKSGGFNNDWDVVYGILMFLLSELPRDMLDKISKLINVCADERDAVERLSAIKNKSYVDLEDFRIPFSYGDLTSKLKGFANLLDATGITSVDKIILNSGKIPRELYNLLKKFLYGSGRVSENVIGRVFEEVFCGSNLFEEIYGVRSRVYGGLGMIENGKPIIKPETLSRLSAILSGARFGIASGSRFKSARHILGDLLQWFSPKAKIFLDDIEEFEEEYVKKGMNLSLKKPNPFSLFKSAENLEPFRFALYVGDSMEDALMVERARRLDSRFLFAGVYEYTSMKSKMMEEFLKFGGDIIMPSVNEIPDVIEALGCEI